MPEILVERVQVEKVEGRVSVAGRGQHHVIVLVDHDSQGADVTVTTPDGQDLEGRIEDLGRLDGIGDALLIAGARRALLKVG